MSDDTTVEEKVDDEQRQYRSIEDNVFIIAESFLVQELGEQLGVKIEAKAEENTKKKSVNVEEMDMALPPLQVKEYEILRKLEDKFRENIKGQDGMNRSLLMALVLNEHVLLEGLPGVGKTEIVKWIANVTGLPFTRIQFIPDMLPTDLIGKEQIDVEKLSGENTKGAVKWVSGPIFSSLVLADEVNRAPSKVQAALLEAMGEKQVTPFGKPSRSVLSPLHQAALEVWPTKFNSGLLGFPCPIEVERRDQVQFTVFATMNPIEQEGTYPLSEAQTDRFCFKTIVPYPERSYYNKILSVVYDGSKHPDAAEINVPVELCRRYFEKKPEHMIPVLLPVYFLLQCRSNILPVKVAGKEMVKTAETLLWKGTEQDKEKLEEDKRHRTENDALERIHDIVFMTNARRNTRGEGQGDSGWLDPEMAAMIRYIQRLDKGSRKEKLMKLMNAEHCQYVKAGASPRGFLKLATAAACRAMIKKGRNDIEDADILAVVHQVLRHRVHMDVHARLAGITPDDVIDNVCRVILGNDKPDAKGNPG